uniref:L1 transposable element RRM domain-containing protein n=1 Tax=Equus caballus TaxID=9796 RepID=A0A9L0TR74_HORSE
MKNSLAGLNSRLDDTDEWISKLDESLKEITQAEQIKEKRIKKNENTLRELWDNIKHTNICIIGGKEKKKGAENLFKEIMAENFPNLVREMDLQVTEANRSPNFINARRPTPQHIVVKLAKVNDKEKILRTARQKKLTYKGTPIRLSADFSAETLQAR